MKFTFGVILTATPDKKGIFSPFRQFLVAQTFAPTLFSSVYLSQG